MQCSLLSTPKDFFKQKKVLFATNSDSQSDDLFKMSFQTYCQVIDQSNFCLIESENGKVYGLNALLKAFETGIKNDFHYLIYLDNDCFITSLKNLQRLFQRFLDEDSAFAGTSDGRVICHRTFNFHAVNPFLSFYNLKKIRNEFCILGQNSTLSFKFSDARKFKESLVTKNTLQRISRPIETYRSFRKNPSFKVPYIETMTSLKPWNKPWTSTNNIYSEPYYKIFLGMYNGILDFSFFYARDFPCPADPSGLTTAIYADEDLSKDSDIVCLHTWFSRFFKSNSMHDGIFHHKRIIDVFQYVKDNFLNNNA